MPEPPSTYKRNNTGRDPYAPWRLSSLTATERTLLKLARNLLLGSEPFGSRERLLFDAVQAGEPYQDAKDAFESLLSKSPKLLLEIPQVYHLFGIPVPKDGESSYVPSVLGLVELGDLESLDAVGRIVTALRRAYRPGGVAAEQTLSGTAQAAPPGAISFEHVAESAALSMEDIKRLAPLTRVRVEGAAFVPSIDVLGWDTLEAFLSSQAPLAMEPPRPVDEPIGLRFMPSKLAWSNLGPFSNATLELSPLTVLIGPSASGKTTALQSLEMISHLRDWGLAPLLDKATWRASHSGLTPRAVVAENANDISFAINGEIHRRGEAWKSASWAIHVGLEPRVVAFKESVRLEEQHELELELGVGARLGASGLEPIHFPATRLALAHQPDPLLRPAELAIAQSLPRWRFVLDHHVTYEPPGVERRAQSSPLTEALRAPMLDYAAFNEVLRAVLGPFKLVGDLIFDERFVGRPPGGRSFPRQLRVDAAPAGVRRVIEILLAFLVEPFPELVAIDEIESHLHEDVLQRLFDVMRGMTYRTRIVLTTHSASALRLVRPQEVRAIRAAPGGSTLEHVDDDPVLAALVEAGSADALLRWCALAEGA